MFLNKRTLLVGVVLISFTAYSVEVQPPNIEASKLEKENIERKYNAVAPDLGSIERKEEEKKQYKVPPPPPPIYEYKFEINKKKLTIQQGERLQKPTRTVETSTNNYNLSNNQEAKQTNIYKGYCYPEYDVEVSIEEVYVPVNCILNRREVVKGEMMLIPQIQSYSLTGELTQIEGKPVKRTINVLTGDRTSKNIASDVDRRIISNIILLTARDTGKAVSDATANIFRSAGRVTMTGNVAGFGTTTVDPTSALDSIPKMAMYTALANLLKTSSNELLADKNRLPPLFKLRKNTELYVEFEL